jgi:hypothetical protein
VVSVIWKVWKSGSWILSVFFFISVEIICFNCVCVVAIVCAYCVYTCLFQWYYTGISIVTVIELDPPQKSENASRRACLLCVVCGQSKVKKGKANCPESRWSVSVLLVPRCCTD